jgi:hypothetical protein
MLLQYLKTKKKLVSKKILLTSFFYFAVGEGLEPSRSS